MTALDAAERTAGEQAPDVREGVDRETVERVAMMAGRYKHGWATEIEMDFAPKGLSEDIVRLISGKNGEPDWMTEWRLEAYRRWLSMDDPDWSMLNYPPIDYQEQYYYAKPKSMASSRSRSTRWTRSCCGPTRSSASL